MDSYRYLREHRPDLLRAVVEVGAPPQDDRLQLAARAEGRAAEIVANLLGEHAEKGLSLHQIDRAGEQVARVLRELNRREPS